MASHITYGAAPFVFLGHLFNYVAPSAAASVAGFASTAATAASSYVSLFPTSASFLASSQALAASIGLTAIPITAAIGNNLVALVEAVRESDKKGGLKRVVENIRESFENKERFQMFEPYRSWPLAVVDFTIAAGIELTIRLAMLAVAFGVPTGLLWFFGDQNGQQTDDFLEPTEDGEAPTTSIAPASLKVRDFAISVKANQGLSQIIIQLVNEGVLNSELFNEYGVPRAGWASVNSALGITDENAINPNQILTFPKELLSDAALAGDVNPSDGVFSYNEGSEVAAGTPVGERTDPTPEQIGECVQPDSLYTTALLYRNLVSVYSVDDEGQLVLCEGVSNPTLAKNWSPETYLNTRPLDGWGDNMAYIAVGDIKGGHGDAAYIPEFIFGPSQEVANTVGGIVFSVDFLNEVAQHGPEIAKFSVQQVQAHEIRHGWQTMEDQIAIETVGGQRTPVAAPGSFLELSSAALGYDTSEPITISPQSFEEPQTCESDGLPSVYAQTGAAEDDADTFAAIVTGTTFGSDQANQRLDVAATQLPPSVERPLRPQWRVRNRCVAPTIEPLG